MGRRGLGQLGGFIGVGQFHDGQRVSLWGWFLANAECAEKFVAMVA
jgi:hypothetical protein